MAVTDQPTAGAHYFKISLPGIDSAGFFKEIDGIGSDHEVITHTTIDNTGKPQVQKFPGQMTWKNITLKRGVDNNNALWTWRQQVINGQIDQARKDGTIEILDWKGTAVVTYSFVHAWPCRYSAPGVNAGGNEVMVEEIEIVHEGLTRT